MGLTRNAAGRKAALSAAELRREGRTVIALAGNPNVGKSTIFNALTGMNQHTGNWPGKTVATARGLCRSGERDYIMVDLPGAYSLMAHSAEEELARDFICFGGAEAVVVVCDATCLERNMNLVLQTMELTGRVLVCVNLMDEAERKNISIDLDGLSHRLGAPVLGLTARERGCAEKILSALDRLLASPPAEPLSCLPYPEPIKKAAERLLPMAEAACGGRLSGRWLSLRLLAGDEGAARRANAFLSGALVEHEALLSAAARERQALEAAFPTETRVEDALASALVRAGEELCRGLVRADENSARRDRRIDRLLTGRLLGYPLMLLLLALVFYLTIAGANYPSRLLSSLLFSLEAPLGSALKALGAPPWLRGMLAEGAYRVLAWVVSVMLPPMAIFFPLFTLLEDAGYLPRVAYNLDRPFKSCRACGKQALTMCMGFGCNAAGVVGCRIIDSPRERLLAILTNSFVPCNGRFPMLIAILTMFFAGGAEGGAVLGAGLLTGVILLGVAATFGATKLLSETLLKGMPSSFVLELPPYRRPQIAKVIVRSVFDRTLFVLGRAAAVAAPAGALLWLMANTYFGGESLINICAEFLEPLGQAMGLDGVLLLAFILGFPANEIVLPIAVMIYTAQGGLTELGSLSEMRQLLILNGWTGVTAACVLVFSLMHWPCSTTLLTIKKETGSWKWTAAAAIIPTAAGFVCCLLLSAAAKLLGF